MRSLWVIRHAKSSWANAGEADRVRCLNARGEKNGEQMSDWFSQYSPLDCLLVSSATRAQATATYVARGFRTHKNQHIIDERLYLADVDTLYDVLNELPDDIQVAAVVAHNPGLTHLVNSLGASSITDNLPTLGCVMFEFEGSWLDLRPSKASLVTLMTPKKLNQVT